MANPAPKRRRGGKAVSAANLPTPTDGATVEKAREPSRQVTGYEIQCFINFLNEREDYLDVLLGRAAAQANLSSENKLSKADFFRELFEHLNSNAVYVEVSNVGSEPKRVFTGDWTFENARTRYQSLERRYKDLKTEEMEKTGEGITAAEQKKHGWVRWEQKRDYKFPHFEKWDRIFGDRANIEPYAMEEAGVGGLLKAGPGGNYSPEPDELLEEDEAGDGAGEGDRGRRIDDDDTGPDGRKDDAERAAVEEKRQSGPGGEGDPKELARRVVDIEKGRKKENKSVPRKRSRGSSSFNSDEEKDDVDPQDPAYKRRGNRSGTPAGSGSFEEMLGDLEESRVKVEKEALKLESRKFEAGKL